MTAIHEAVRKGARCAPTIYANSASSCGSTRSAPRLGDAVLDAFTGGQGWNGPLPRVTKLAVRSMPASAAPDEQLHAAGIDAGSIVAAAREAVEVI